MVNPMLCSGCMNTKAQDPVLNGHDQHIPICFNVYILTLDSEWQQIFSSWISVCLHAF